MEKVVPGQEDQLGEEGGYDLRRGGRAFCSLCGCGCGRNRGREGGPNLTR